jgi:hypothetical protein
MNRIRISPRSLGALLAADAALLAVSGIPAFEQADSGWKWVVGGVAWAGFVLVSVALVALSALSLRQRRSRGPASSAPKDRRRRSQLVGLALLAAAMIADLVECAVDPASSGTAESIYRASAEQHGLVVLCGYLLLASSLFLLPGVLLVTRTIRRRGRVVARIATVLGMAGALGHAALATAYLAWAALPGESADAAEVTAAVERMMGSAAIAPLALGFVAFPLALIATLAALVRAGDAPVWILALVVAAPVAAAASVGGQTAGTAAALVLLMAATGVAALRIALRPRDTPRSHPAASPVPAPAG